MTTESNNEVTNTQSTNVDNSAGAIDINKLIDKPYSEMTEEEIDAVVEWKAQVKARNEQFQQTLQAIKDSQQAQLKVMQETAERDAARQDAFLQASIERLNRANGGA
jgi:deoxyribose-phosphate aldolase